MNVVLIGCSCLLCIRYLDVFGFNETVDDDFQESDMRKTTRRVLTGIDRQLNSETRDDLAQVPTVTDDAFSRIQTMLMVNEYEQQLMGIVLLFMGINVRARRSNLVAFVAFICSLFRLSAFLSFGAFVVHGSNDSRVFCCVAQVLYNLRLVPFLGNLVLAVMSTILDKLVLSFLLIWVSE